MTSVMSILFRAINVLLPENLKLRLLRVYKSLPFCFPHIILHPTLICNYKCSYCLYHRYLDTQAKLYTTVLPYEEWLVLFKKFPRSTITISGGEPLLYKNLDKLLLGLAKRHIISQVISNISSNLDVLIRARKANFRVMTSFHKEFCSLEEFTKNLLYLKKHKFNVMVNYVCTEENLKELAYYKDYFEKKVNVTFRLDAYEDLERDIDDLPIKIHGVNYITDRQRYNNYKPKECQGGYKYFIVKPNADVYRCHSGFMYSINEEFKTIADIKDKEQFFIGNLNDTNFVVKHARFICHSPCRGVCDIELGAVKLKKQKN